MSRLGTTWVAPGEGSTFADLRKAAGRSVCGADYSRRTNLRLTGAPWQPYDTGRLDSPSFCIVPLGACETCCQAPCDCEDADEVAP